MSEEIVLEEISSEPRVWISVSRTLLTSKLSDVYTADQLAKLSTDSGMPLTSLQAMTVIAFIKSDIAGKDIMGYKKYRDVLKKEGFDV